MAMTRVETVTEEFDAEGHLIKRTTETRTEGDFIHTPVPAPAEPKVWQPHPWKSNEVYCGESIHPSTLED